MRTSSLVFALFLVGCGADTPAPVPGTAFLGTWSFATGTNNVACPTGTTPQSLTGNITIKTGTTSDLVVIDDEGCDFPYTVSGMTASAMNVSCTRPAPQLGAGVTAATTFTFITLSTNDGKSMTDTFGGTVAFTSAAGTLDCTFSGSATLTKASAM